MIAVKNVAPFVAEDYKDGTGWNSSQLNQDGDISKCGPNVALGMVIHLKIDPRTIDIVTDAIAAIPALLAFPRPRRFPILLRHRLSFDNCRTIAMLTAQK